MAINCYIAGLPTGGIYPKTFGFGDYLTTEQYYDKLEDNLRGQGTGEFDTHDWDSTDLTTDQQAEIVQQTMERALSKMGQGADGVPSHVQESLKALKDLRVKNWHRELRKFVGRHVNSITQDRTWSRRNRRFGLLEAGIKTGLGKKVAVAFDTSGSMSTEELQRCLAETLAMLKAGVVGHLIQFDTQVNKVEPLRRTQEFEIVGRGGTSFVDLMQRVDKLNCDALIVFTDGDDYDNCQQPKTPVLWVLTDGARNKYNWGTTTHLEKR
jgi:predicted metal-dependent peptidase